MPATYLYPTVYTVPMGLYEVILLRLLVPLLALRWQVTGALLAIAADGYDYQTLCSSFGAHNYQYMDKLLDTYFLVIILLASRTWQNALAKKIVAWLFVYRLIGVMLFFVLQQEYILFFFPNLILDFFLLYALYYLITKSSDLVRDRRDAIIILGIMAIPKLLNEYYLHVYHAVSLPSPALLNSFYTCSNYLQLAVYFAGPLTYLGWRVYRRQTAK